MDANVKRLISDTVSDLISNGITVKFEADEYASYKNGKKFICCEGWFDETEIVCATKHNIEYWLPVFSHEYCHFRQFKEKSKFFVPDYYDDILDDFLCDKKVSKKRLKKAIKKIQEMEWDCEKRSVALLLKYKINFDVERTIQRANAYIYFYSVIRKLKSWYKSAPGLIKEIVDVMPTEFLELEDYRTVSPEIKRLYKRLCLKKHKENETFE